MLLDKIFQYSLGDSTQEQLWSEFRGVVQECIHHGPTQTWGAPLQWAQGGSHHTSREQGKSIYCLLAAQPLASIGAYIRRDIEGQKNSLKPYQDLFIKK